MELAGRNRLKPRLNRTDTVDLTPEADGIWFYLAVAVGFAMALLLLAGVIAGIWLKRQR